MSEGSEASRGHADRGGSGGRSAPGQMTVERFEEIEAKRIRVVDGDGTVRLVLTSPPLPDATLRGNVIAEQNRQEAGILFYNDEGTECGGLTYHGRRGPDGIDAGQMLAFDSYEQDQTVTLSFRQFGDQRGYGISMQDRPLVPIDESLKEQQRIEQLPDGSEKEESLRELREQHAQRIFCGRLETGEICLFLMDSKGRPRIRIGVDAQDTPRLEFLDEKGEVTYSWSS